MNAPSRLSSRGPYTAMASAVLFGAGAPLAKLLLGEGINPGLLAGLLYLGSGVGLSLVRWQSRLSGLPSVEAPLRRGDLPWLGLAVLCGGVIGPLLLMIGLATTAAATAALLLNANTVSRGRRPHEGSFATLAGAPYARRLAPAKAF